MFVLTLLCWVSGLRWLQVLGNGYTTVPQNGLEVGAGGLTVVAGGLVIQGGGITVNTAGVTVSNGGSQILVIRCFQPY